MLRYLLLLPLLALVLIGCSPKDGGTGGGTADDPMIVEDFGKGQEAGAFLQGPNNVLYTFDKAKAQALVTELMNLGVTKVVAADILDTGGTVVAESLIVELPTDAAKRNAFFAWDKQRAEAAGKSPSTDSGQQYVRIVFG